jgi:hypothetical protein
MTIDTDATAPSTTESAALPTSTAPTGGERPEPWRRRSFQIAAAFVALAVLGAFVANNLIAQQFTADGAVRQYLIALQSGDTNKAWDAIQVSAPTAPATASLTNQAALQAALAIGKLDIRSFAISGDTQIDSSTTVVAFTYDTSAGSRQAKVIVQRSGETHFGIYPAWHLVIAPALLQITPPKGSDGVSIDGKAVSLPQGAKSMVAVLPLAHKVQFEGTQMLAPQTITVDTFLSLGQSVAFQPQLTPAGLTRAKTAIMAYFATCSHQTGLTPTGCPQSISNAFVSSGQWQLVGDPTQDLSVSFGTDLNPVGTGHFEMVFAYQEAGTTGTIHSPSSGAYSAALAPAFSDIAVTAISLANGVPALQRPAAATDQAAKNLVAKAFATCARGRAASLADCPQGLAFPLASNISWKLSGNPLSAATVSFDQNSGLFTVQGNFSMNTTYYVGGYPYTRPSYLSTYMAYLLWDGHALKLITISGGF